MQRARHCGATWAALPSLENFASCISMRIDSCSRAPWFSSLTRREASNCTACLRGGVLQGKQHPWSSGHQDSHRWTATKAAAGYIEPGSHHGPIKAFGVLAVGSVAVACAYMLYASPPFLYGSFENQLVLLDGNEPMRRAALYRMRSCITPTNVDKALAFGMAARVISVAEQDDNEAVREEAYRAIQALAEHKAGREQLMIRGAVPVLAERVLTESGAIRNECIIALRQLSNNEFI